MSNQELLEEFERLTDVLLEMDTNGMVDDIIETINEKLAARQVLVDQIKSEEKSDEIKEILSRIMQKDNQLTTKFTEIKMSISNKIFDVVEEKKLSSVKKKAHRGYLNMGQQIDGYFIDRKK